MATKVQQVFNNCKKTKKPRKTEKPKNGKNQNQYKTPKKNKNKKEDFPLQPPMEEKIKTRKKYYSPPTTTHARVRRLKPNGNLCHGLLLLLLIVF